MTTQTLPSASSQDLQRPTLWPGICLAFGLGVLGFAYAEAIRSIWVTWTTNDNYSHGVFVPFLSGYLLWTQREKLLRTPIVRTKWSIPVIVIGTIVFALGELATLYVVVFLSLWIVLVGLFIALQGTARARVAMFSLGYLLTAIPLPEFLHRGLSAQLQLLSSALGVGCLQLVGVTAFREGNVIDLGPIQLQVVEACSGLRYLFPLASLALLAAYLFHSTLWKRVTLFLSSIPIAIMLNGLRISAIGILVEVFGQEAAEGFLHLFEGWVFFLVSLGCLYLVMCLLNRIGRPTAPPTRTTVSPTQAASTPAALPTSSDVPLVSRQGAPSYALAIALVLPLGILSTQLEHRAEPVVPRANFADFPHTLDRWTGTPYPLEREFIDTLRFDDYLLSDYRSSGSTPINLYVAYYRSQKKGQSAHSPKTCIPGGGWEITSLERRPVPASSAPSGPFEVNRALIQKGSETQVVLYWFKQRERVLTNEYLVKLYLFWDALTRARTDGALIRLVSVVQPNERVEVVEGRLLEFAAVVEPQLVKYVPD